MLRFCNDAPATNDLRTLAHAGNGFLMRRGYTVVWLAWQGDLLPGNGRMVLELPIAPVNGLVRVEYIADRPGVTTFPLSGHQAWGPVAADALPQACPHSFDDVCRDEDWYPDRAGEQR